MEDCLCCCGFYAQKFCKGYKENKQEMILHTLHTVSAVVLVLAIIGKVVIHYYLDKSSGKTIHPASVLLSPLQYLRPYKDGGSIDHAVLKTLCNFLLLLAAISLLLNLVLGLLIYFR